MKLNDITTLRAFKYIYETRSLTSTAEIMGLSKPALSKRLEGLELELGLKLFSRTTRSILPTGEANKLIHQVTEIIERVDGLSADFGKRKEAQRSKIKVTCIASMSQSFVGRIIKDYQTKNPSLEIELLVTDSVLDPIEHNIDLAVRVNPSKNSRLVGKKMGTHRLHAVASPDYLKRQPKIRTLDDLLQHDLLCIDKHLSVFKNLEIKRSFITNDSPLISQLILAGSGLGIRSSWDTKQSIKDKKLAYALPENTFKPQGDIWLLSTADRLQTEVIRSLYDYLLEECVYYID